jgi:hypothetical protein
MPGAHLKSTFGLPQPPASISAGSMGTQKCVPVPERRIGCVITEEAHCRPRGLFDHPIGQGEQTPGNVMMVHR